MFGKKKLLHICKLISLMNVMGEFSKTVAAGGEKGGSFSLYYKIVKQTKFRCS